MSNFKKGEFLKCPVGLLKSKEQEIIVNIAYRWFIGLDLEECYVWQDFVAFVTSKMSGGDRANDRHYLNRIKLETLELEQEIVSITAAEPHILGVLADGRIVFWYQFNLAEKGICVTSATSASRE